EPPTVDRAFDLEMPARIAAHREGTVVRLRRRLLDGLRRLRLRGLSDRTHHVRHDAGNDHRGDREEQDLLHRPTGTLGNSPRSKHIAGEREANGATVWAGFSRRW